jgi:general secretion pathway protein C
MAVAQRLQDKALWLALTRRVTALALVVWLAWVLADTMWLLLSGPSDPVPVSSDLPRVTVSEQGGGVTFTRAQVEGWQLFGVWQGEQVSSSGPVEAPETRLRLELLGVFQTGDTSKAGAIIAEQGGKGELFRPGDRLPGNATLEEVYADRVILRRQGQLETLRLKAPELSGEGVREVATSEPEQAPERRAREPRERPDRNQSSSVGTDLARQREQIIGGMALESGDEGYLITDGAPAELLDQVGLQVGDVIVSVNGHNVGDRDSDIAALQEYRDSGSATIVVQRGAQRFTVTVPP